MLESLKHEDLQFQELSPEEKQARGILARLTGPIASFTKGTRNGRKYSDKLWEKAFDSPLVKEMFKNGGLPGELQHPENRSETDPTKIAIMMPEPPKKDNNGHLVASVDILDTPCGQIAYQLGKYGFKFGISSRGEGDLIQDFSGEESVDPDTYTLNAFDLVLIPACEDARLQFNESLNTKSNNKLRTILSEALNNASDTDRKIMEEALDELNIDDNWRYIETYKDEDIYYDPDSKKYIVGELDNQTVLNSLKNAKQYIDRYGVFDESYISSTRGDDNIIHLEYIYDTYDDRTDRADRNLRGRIDVKAESEEQAIQKAKDNLDKFPSYQNNIRHFEVTKDRYTNVNLLEEQEGREETKPNDMASDILKDKPQNNKESEEQSATEVSVNINDSTEDKDVEVESEDDILEEALTPQEKMDAWASGNRRENIKACGDVKLYKYLDICRNSGYLEQAEIIVDELENRGLPVPDDGSKRKSPTIPIKPKIPTARVRNGEIYILADTAGISLIGKYIHPDVADVELVGNEEYFVIDRDDPYANSLAIELMSLLKGSQITEALHEFYTNINEDSYDGIDGRASWDTDFHRLDVAYNHNFKQYKDMEADSGIIRDFTDDLDAQGKEYDIYKHKSDPGCTIFFQESLTEDISWDDLNGTEQSAVEAALVEISNGSTVEDAVHGAIAMYNEENTNSDYEDEDFYMEEADYTKVLDYIRNHESLNESQFGMFNYTYAVHACPDGKDIILAGSEDIDSITKAGIEQAQRIFENPWMTNEEKYDYLDTMYISNDDTEEIDVSPEFDDHIDELMSELSTRIQMNEDTYTRDELMDKFGTDDLDIINAGNEEDVELEEGVIPDSAKVLDSGYCNKDEWPEIKKEQLNRYKRDYKNVKCTLQKSDTKGLRMWVTYTNDVELAADSDGAILEQLQNILKQNKSLEEKVKSLQEKLSVGYAKEMELKEELDTYRQKVSKLSKRTKEIKVLTEKLSKAEKILKDNKLQAEGKISTLNESIQSKGSENKDLKKNISDLNEAVDRKNSKIRSLNEQIAEYKDQLSSKDNDIEKLKEQYETGQKDLEQVRENYSKKLEQQNQIIEKYRRVAKNSVKRYVESQAIRLGVKSDEIVNRLPKNYSFNDIDKICEDLQEYKFNMSNLPFGQYGLNENLKVTAKNINKGLIEANPEDEITDYDLKIAEAFL